MKKLLLLSVIVSGIAVLFYSCEKATIDQGSFSKIYDPGAPIDSVKFSADILPIFTAECKSCHNTGTTAPDLSEANAYNSLTATPGQYIDVANPPASHLYLHITEIPNSHGGGTKTSAGEKILVWIQQGALNN
jgi:hypothetical protein